VYYDLLDGIIGERANDRRGLHEVGPGSNDVDDFHLFSVLGKRC
jgi:hypothetical protein